MTDDPSGPTRRQRRRATARQGPPAPGDQPAESPSAATAGPIADRPTGSDRGDTRRSKAAPRRTGSRRARGDRDSGEGALRDLVGAGPSQVGVEGALRARDVNRPTDADLAEAERTVVIVRRNWKPPA